MAWENIKIAAVKVLVFAGSLLIAGGCDSKSSTPTTQAATANSAPAEVRIGYFANFTHAQAVLGVASGDFAAAVAPAKLTPRVCNAGPELIFELMAGQIDIGYVGPSPILNAYSKTKGEGIRVIAGAAANGVIIVAGKDSGIKSMADLAGKKIATPQQFNTQDISARHYLQTQLGQTDLSNIMPIANGDQLALMQRGQIDASWSPEPWGSILIEKAGARLIAEEKDLWPGGEFGLTMVVTTPEFLAAHGDIVQRVLAAHHAWTVKLQQDPAGCAPRLGQAIFDLTHKKLAEGVLTAAIGRTRFTDEPMMDTFKTYAQWAVDLKVGPPGPDLSGLIDDSILKQVPAVPTTGK